MGMILKAAKWLLPRLISGLKVSGRFVSQTGTKAMNFVLPKAQSIITKSGTKLASTVTKPVIAKSILKATEWLSKEAVLKPIIKDLSFKVAKEGIERIPVIGKGARKVADFADAFIGIPFI